MRRWIPSWPLLAGLAAAIRALADGTGLLNDPDTYLHVTAGRWMLAHHALPVHDPFSHSMAGAAWVPHEWLAELVLAVIYAGAGWGGLMVLTAACLGIAAAILTRRLLDHGEAISSLIIVAASVALLLPHTLARPHMVALPLLAGWCAAMFAARDAGRAPSLWLLPMMMLWANLHGSFMFGLALTAYLGAEAVWAGPNRLTAARRWGMFLALAAAASLLTPNGVAGFLEPFRLLDMKVLQASFIEWLAPDFQNLQPVELWVLGLLALALSIGIRLPWTRAMLLLGLLHLALTHVRHADLLAVAGPLAIGAALGPQLVARIRSEPPSALARGVARLAQPSGAAGIAVAAAAAIAIALPVLFWPFVREDGPSTPGAAVAAVAAAARLGLAGPVFNAEVFGGYLVFRGIPTFIDGRIELYGDDFLNNYLSAEGGHEPALAETLQKYDIAWTLLEPSNHAVAELDRLPGWRRVYADKTAVIHVRASSPSLGIEGAIMGPH